MEVGDLVMTTNSTYVKICLRPRGVCAIGIVIQLGQPDRTTSGDLLPGSTALVDWGGLIRSAFLDDLEVVS